MTYCFHPEARLEYREAARFYKSRRRQLGAAFTLEIEGAITWILERPIRCRILEGDVRICRTRTFPYAVLYTIHEDSVLIPAVMSLRREPGYWRTRLTS